MFHFIHRSQTTDNSKTTPNHYAGFWIRLLAFVVDSLLIAPVLILIYGLAYQSKESALLLEYPIAIVIAFTWVFFLVRWGQTPGKMLCQIKVVQIDGTKLNWKQSILRELPRTIFLIAQAYLNVSLLKELGAEVFVDLSLLDAAAILGDSQPSSSERLMAQWWLWDGIVLLANKQKRAAHDFIAGTLVVRTNTVEEEKEHVHQKAA